MNKDGARKRRVNMYISYAAEDESVYQKLRSHLKALQNIASTYQLDIVNSQSTGAGYDVLASRKDSLFDANIILLLVSAAFVADSQCMADMKYAMEQAAKRIDTVRTVPVKARPMNQDLWDRLPVHPLQALPRNNPFIPERSNDRDQVLSEIAGDISSIIDTMFPLLPYVEDNPAPTNPPVNPTPNKSKNVNIGETADMKYSDAELHKHILALQKELSYLYDDAATIRSIIFDANIPIGNVSMSGSAKTVWFAVLQETLRRDRVLDLVTVVANDYPERATLQREQKFWEGYYKQL